MVSTHENEIMNTFLKNRERKDKARACPFLHLPDPMQAVLQTLERQHEEEKRTALERQRLMYEQELQQLRRQLTPDRQSMQIPQSQPLQSQYRSLERLSQGGMSSSASTQHRLRQWSEER